MPDAIKDTIVKPRIGAIDVLRGIVMVIMALDHTRDFFSGFRFSPTDMEHTTPALFFTRWITHFCAPVFVFLSGTSAFLSMGRGKTKQQASWSLLTRGLWLIVLEVTIVGMGWSFAPDYHRVFLQVIWAIGCSMVALSALIYLPRWLILGIGLAMIFLHNTLDGVHPAGDAGVLWEFLHVQGPVMWGSGNTIMVLYPLIPWIGVMSVGFCIGPVFRREEKGWRRIMLVTGSAAIVLFIALRFADVYGDPSPWHTQQGMMHPLLSFLNCTKYPPSLLYLLMTLGPAMLLLGLLPNGAAAGRGVAGVFMVYGRVPLFYYILHIYLIHLFAIICGAVFSKYNVPDFIGIHPGFRLPVVYAVWLTIVAILYRPCKWFMQVKMNSRKWWLSYL